MSARVRDVIDNDANLRLHREIDSYGNVLDSFHYDAAGDPVSDTDPGYVTVDFIYTGKLFDAYTDLQQSWNRWYDPATGGWISEDFIWDGYNKRAYVGNGPTMATDPSGLEKWLFPWDPGASWGIGTTLHLWGSHTPSEHVRGLYTTDTEEGANTNAALESAGECYTDSAGEAHQALQGVGAAGPAGALAMIVDEALTGLEGDDLHKRIMDKAPPPQGNPILGGLPPNALPPQVNPFPPPQQIPGPPRGKDNAGRVVNRGIRDWGPPILTIIAAILGSQPGSEGDQDPVPDPTCPDDKPKLRVPGTLYNLDGTPKDPLDQLDGIKEAQRNGHLIEDTGKSENNVKKMLRDWAQGIYDDYLD